MSLSVWLIITIVKCVFVFLFLFYWGQIWPPRQPYYMKLKVFVDWWTTPAVLYMHFLCLFLVCISICICICVCISILAGGSRWLSGPQAALRGLLRPIASQRCPGSCLAGCHSIHTCLAGCRQRLCLFSARSQPPGHLLSSANTVHCVSTLASLAAAKRLCSHRS